MIQLTLTLKMTTAQVVETSVTVNNNSPIQDYVHPDNHTQPTCDWNFLLIYLHGITIDALPLTVSARPWSPRCAPMINFSTMKWSWYTTWAGWRNLPKSDQTIVTEKGSRYTLNICKNKESNMVQQWQQQWQQHGTTLNNNMETTWNNSDRIKRNNTYSSARFVFQKSVCAV